jgi:type IV secretory pathway protease TraF
MLVLTPVPASVQPWRSRWTPLLKPVAALAGEEVCVHQGELWVAGQGYGPIYLEAEGKPLPQFDGCHVVPEGAVLLASTQPKSLDGRYFGMTPMAELTAQAVPLWVWR